MSSQPQLAADPVANDDDAASQRTWLRLWDLPLRVFHWSLVGAVTTAIVTGKLGGAWMPLHAKAGLLIVGLVVFRLIWGLVGSTHARFASFVPTWTRLRAYLKGQWHGAGHNPLGAFSVFALLALLAAQVSTGLFSSDDIAFNGPLFNRIDEALASRLGGIHQQLATALLWLMGLHVVAIVFYWLFKRDNLVKPMVTGWKEVDASAAKPNAVGTPAAAKGGPVALSVALLTAVVAVYFASGTAL